MEPVARLPRNPPRFRLGSETGQTTSGTDVVTGRFFRPRVSEEFYDTEEDFDNVRNLIDDPIYKKKIAELAGQGSESNGGAADA